MTDRIREALELAERRAALDGRRFTRFGFGVAVEQIFRTPLIPPELSDAVLAQRGDVRVVGDDRYELLPQGRHRWSDVRLGVLAFAVVVVAALCLKPDLLCPAQTRVCADCEHPR